MRKVFYKVFDILYQAIAKGRGLTKKEDLYRIVFGSTNFGEVWSDDPLRKVTSGGRRIHDRIIKAACTEEGFESLRAVVEAECVPFMTDGYQVAEEMLAILQEEPSIPSNVKAAFTQSLESKENYNLSRFISAMLLCADDADRNGEPRTDWRFARLTAITSMPVFLTPRMESSVDTLLGREHDLDKLRSAVFGSGKVMLSGVGGIGKTELVKRFVTDLDVGCPVRKIAWVHYDNHDLRSSLKNAFAYNCDPDEAWMRVQELAEREGLDLLLVVDNVEHIEDDYLLKLGSLPCRVVVTSRQRKLPGFGEPMVVGTLDRDTCRELFYSHYQFDERDNETVADIIELSARLTIMIVFIAKVAYMEGWSLTTLYRRLVELGFKLSEEDVNCEHERLQDDAPIIQQMCILFSLLSYSQSDRTILTYASVIPGLEFDVSMAKRWFGVKKNGSLLKFFNMGMLEHMIRDKKHIYWMHSVIAAAVREQQKDSLYETATPFIRELSAELDYGDNWGKGYTKLELIPFSWSVADIFEGSWGSEDDADFLLRLYYVCFEASNYPICKTLMEKVLEIDKKGGDPEHLIRDKKNMGELLLRLNDMEGALHNLNEAEEIMTLHDPECKSKREWAFLWHAYGNLFYHAGIPQEALRYYEKSKKLDEMNEDCPRRELSTDYSSIAAVYQELGESHKAYDMIKLAMETDDEREDDSETVMNYRYLATICTDLYYNGYPEYEAEARDAFAYAISFQELHAAKFSNDLADLYLEYSSFLYQIGIYDESREYSMKAEYIYRHLYGEDSYPVCQCKVNDALIMAEEDKLDEAIRLYSEVMELFNHMSNLSFSDYARDCTNYATLLDQAGFYEDSKFFWEKSIAIIRKYFPEDSMRLAESYLGLGNVCMGLEQYEEALGHLEKLKVIVKNEPPRLRVALRKLGDCCGFLRRLDEAERHYNEALSLCDDDKPQDDAAISYVGLALVSNWKGREEDFLRYRERARAIADAAGDEDITSYVHSLDII